MPVANTSNISTIQILRSYANSTPLTLEDGQLAFSFKSNTLYIGSNTGGVIAISDQATANLARDLANTKVSKSGDRMTGPLQFFGPNFAIGEYDVVGGIDVWANNNTSHAQLNFANTNFAYVDGYEAALQTPNSQITVFATGNVEIFTSTDGSVTRDTWTFDTDGTLTVPGPISGLGESKLDFTTYGPNTAYLTTTNDDSTALFMGAMSAELYANTTVQIRTNTKGTSQNWTFGENGSLTFPDNTIQTTAYTPGGEIDEVARATANAAYFHANGSFLKANAGYNQANTGTILAQAAFDKANTGGTITGNVYISNNLSVANTITTNALNISTNTSNVSLTKGTGITSWNYSGLSKSVIAEETTSTGLFLSPDGLNMYVNGSAGDDVSQYTLSTAFDVSTATFVRSFSTAAQDTLPQDVFFKPDGLSMFIVGATNDTVFQYTLSSAFDISTASYASKSFSVTSQETAPVGLWFKPDGTVMYVIGTTNDTVFQYTLGTPWDVSTASYASISFVVAQESSPQQVNLSADGTKMWILGTTGDDINEYTLGTAWNVSTATFVNNFYVGFQETTPTGLFIDSTAVNRVYMVGQSTDTVYQYNTDTNSIAITTDVLTVNNNARIQGNLAVQSAAYVDGSAIIQGALSVGGSTSLSTTSVGGTFTASSTLALTAGTTATVQLGTSVTTGNIFIGGATQTGNITFGYSSVNQTANIANGTTAAGSTKVVNLGTSAGSGSNTRINIGPSTAGANGNVTFNPQTTVAIQNVQTSVSNTTGALTVLGGVGVSGNVNSDAVYSVGYFYRDGTSITNTANNASANTIITQGVDASQNVRIDYSNSAITIIQGVDVGQNNRMTISDGVNASQNVRIDYSNTAITIIQGVDVGQNSRMTIIEGVDVTQNTRLTVIEGTDVSQNARMTISDGVNASQNVRLDYSNTAITIIQGVDVTQNTNISNKVNLTGSLNQTVSGNVTISQDLIVAGNLIITGNINTQNVQQLAVADPLIVLGIGNYVSDTKDIGFAAHYNDGTNAHTGIIRDSGTKEYYIFQGYTPEVDALNNVIITDPTFRTANLNASYVKGNLIATTTVVNGIDLSAYTQATYAQANVTIGVDASQNARMTIIEGTDVSQNARMTIADGVDASQNVRLDYSNTAITIIQGVDVGQNTRLTVIEGTDVSQNARMTIIEGVDVGQNTNISTVTALAQAAFNRANTEPDAASYLANTIIVANSTGYLSNSSVFFTSSNNNLIVSGNVQVSNGSITTPATELTLGVTGDTFGAQYLRMQNRGGQNGPLFDGTSSSVALVDFGFKTSNGQRNIRYETRGGVYKYIPSGDGLEFQIGDTSAPTFVISNNSVYIAKTTASTSNTTGALVVGGGLGVAGNAYFGLAQTGQSLQPYTGGGYAAIYNGAVTPSGANYTLAHNATATYLNSPSGGAVYLAVNAGAQATITNGTVTINPTTASTSNTTGALVISGGTGITGNLFMSSANNFMSTYNGAQSYRLGWTDNYFMRNNQFGGAEFSGSYLNITSNFYTSSLFYARGLILNDAGNNTVLFAGSSPVRLQNTATSISNTTGSLIVGGGVGISGNTNIYNGSLTVTGINPFTPVGSENLSSVDFVVGRNAAGSLIAGVTQADVAFQYMAGGYKHFISTRHNAGGVEGNEFKFYINAGGASTTSTTPGTGNQLAVSFSANTAATSNTSGAVRVNGGLGVSGNVYVSNTFSIITESAGNRPFIMQPGVSGSLGARLGVQSESIDFYTTGGYPIWFSTNGPRSTIQLTIATVSSAVNYLQVAGNTTGNGPVISGQGSDTNVAINLQPKGTGNVNISAANTVMYGNVYIGNINSSVPSNITANALFQTFTYPAVGGNVNDASMLVRDSNWAMYSLTSTAGGYYARNIFGMNGSSDIRIGHSGGTSLLGGVYVFPGTNKNFFVYNSVLSSPLLTVDTTNNNVTISNTTPVSSTSNTTGALIVNGGLGLSGNLSMNLATSSTGTTTTSRITLSQGNYIYCDDTTTGSIVFAGSRYYYFNAGIIYNGNSFVQRGTLYNDTGNNTVLFAGLSPVKIQNGTASSNTTTGALVVQGGVGISGALNATTKSFNIPHPTKEGKDLRYGSLEGPEFGVYVRGTLKGSNVIELPDYWTKLVDANTITVSLTPIGKYQKLSVKEVKDNTIIINSDGWFKKEIHCYYTVFGERADVDKLDVEG